MRQLLLFLFMCISFSMIGQSPWTKEKNEAYLQLSYTTIPNYTELFGNPTYNTERGINDNTLQFYSEYGFTNKTTLIVSLPLKIVASNDLVDSNTIPVTIENRKTDLGNIQLGLKHKFIHEKWLLTGQVVLEANTSNFEEASGLRTGYDAWTVTPLLITGTSFDKWYIQAFTGVDIRTNNYSSSYKLGGEVGHKTLDWLWVAAFIDGVGSFKNGDITIPTTNVLTGLYVNDQTFAGYGLKFIGEINERTGVSLGLGGAFGGRNVAKTPAISLGVFCKI